MTQKYRIRFIILSNWCDVGFLMHGNVPAICAWAWLSTRCDFISLNAWEREIRNSQYAVDATAGVYSFVSGLLFLTIFFFSFSFFRDFHLAYLIHLVQFLGHFSKITHLF